MLVLFGWAGEWIGVLLVGWILAGVALTSRLGERLVVWWYRGYRPTPAQWDVIDGPWGAALRRCDFGLHRFDLYLQQSGEPNAYSLGRRSVVVTVGLLELTASGRLTPAMVEAVLIHELGHHATRATKHGLFTSWLGAPWRITSHFVLGILIGGHRLRSSPLVIVAISVIVLALAGAIQRDDYGTVAVLCVLAVLGPAASLGESATSRRRERLADAYASAVGVGDHLVSALRVIDPPRLRRRPLRQGLAARHPESGERIAAIWPGAGLCSIQRSVTEAAR
jgi:STE24 endopeptidase